MAESNDVEKRQARGPGVTGSGLELSLKANPASSTTTGDALKWREQALDLREELLNRREQDLDRREVDLSLRERTLGTGSSAGAGLRKLPCDQCHAQGRVCGRSEPCFDAAGYLLHHHHSCQVCHDAHKAQRRAQRHGRNF